MLALFLVLPARQHYSWRTLWLFCTMDATFSARVHLTQPVQQLGQAVVVFSFGVLGAAFSQAKVRFETLGARYMVIFLWGWLRWLCVAGAALGARDGVFWWTLLCQKHHLTSFIKPTAIVRKSS